MNPPIATPPDSLRAGREEIVTWVARSLAAVATLWFVATEITTPAFFHTLYGTAFAVCLAGLVAAAVLPRSQFNLRLSLILSGLAIIWILGLCYIGPNTGSGMLSVLGVLLVTVYWGLNAGLITTLLQTLAWVLIAVAWTHHGLSMNDTILVNDPHLGSYWIRAGIVSTLGVTVMVIIVHLTIRRLQHLAAIATASVSSLRESEEKLRQLVEAINQAFWIADVKSRQFVYVSPNYGKILGRPASRPEDTFKNWAESLHPDDRDRMVQRFDDMNIIGLEEVNYRMIRADGSIRWIRARAFPILDASGQAVRIAGVAEDITERKDLEAQLLHSQRMEAVGTLASGIAHDLNNMLTPLAMVSALLRDRATTEEDREFLSAAESGARRGAGMLKQLLALGKGAPANQTTVHVPDLVREVVQFVRGTFSRTIEIAEVIDPALPSIEADPTQLHQVIMNLCINARDAMKDGGTLTLTATLAPDQNFGATGAPFKRTSPFIVIHVSDTGHGIPPENLERIFDPFFTTKGAGEGTGLGLASAHRIVNDHRGWIRVHSEVGRGTTFSVFLPTAADLATVAPRAA